MQWNEHQHAWIVSEYYIQLVDKYGENGKKAFIQAAQTYGEERGKRMAMRAIRDGRELDFNTYFTYGEYAATPEFFDVNMWCEKGVVNEQVTRCPWADVFARRGKKDCGAVYCKEIDKAVAGGWTRCSVCFSDPLYPEVAERIAENGFDVKVTLRENGMGMSSNVVSWYNTKNKGEKGKVEYITDESKKSKPPLNEKLLTSISLETKRLQREARRLSQERNTK